MVLREVGCLGPITPLNNVIIISDNGIHESSNGEIFESITVVGMERISAVGNRFQARGYQLNVPTIIISFT